MSDDRKGFFSKIYDNIKQEMTVNPEMKVFCSINRQTVSGSQNSLYKYIVGEPSRDFG